MLHTYILHNKNNSKIPLVEKKGIPNQSEGNGTLSKYIFATFITIQIGLSHLQ